MPEELIPALLPKAVPVEFHNLFRIVKPAQGLAHKRFCEKLLQADRFSLNCVFIFYIIDFFVKILISKKSLVFFSGSTETFSSNVLT